VISPKRAVTVLSEKDSANYFKVRTTIGKEGWMRGKYLIPEGAAEATVAPSTAAFATAESKYPKCGGEKHYRWAEKIDATSGSATATHIADMLNWSDPEGLSGASSRGTHNGNCQRRFNPLVP